jgi:hypothetical protein
MVAPLVIAGAAVIGKYILKKGLQKAIKKYGKESVSKTKDSKSFKKLLENPPMTTGSKVILGGSTAVGGLGLVAINEALTVGKKRDKYFEADKDSTKLQGLVGGKEIRKLIKKDKEKFSQAKLKIKEFKAKEAKEKYFDKGNKKNKKYSNNVRIVVEE